MGVKQSRGTALLSSDELERVFVLPDGIWMVASQRYAPDALTGFRFLGSSMREAARLDMDAGIPREGGRAIGCLLGLAVGDALGAPLEFHPVRYPDEEERNGGLDPSKGGGWFRAGFDNPQLWEDTTDLRETNRFLLRMGQWTDDTSMALCLADSLLTHGGFHPRDLRLRFSAWWMLGYNNAFRLDQAHRDEVWGSAGSVGLGGIIGDYLKEFTRLPADYTCEGSLRSSGNGSIMRNAPIPIMYRHDINMAMEASWRQSKTTHQGEEAADCARLLTWICVRAINSGAGKSLLDDLSAFPARLYSTRCLAAAQQEERHDENKDENLCERDWRWRRRDFRYAAGRATQARIAWIAWRWRCIAYMQPRALRRQCFEPPIPAATLTLWPQSQVSWREPCMVHPPSRISGNTLSSVGAKETSLLELGCSSPGRRRQRIPPPMNRKTAGVGQSCDERRISQTRRKREIRTLIQRQQLQRPQLPLPPRSLFRVAAAVLLRVSRSCACTRRSAERVRTRPCHKRYNERVLVSLHAL